MRVQVGRQRKEMLQLQRAPTVAADLADDPDDPPFVKALAEVRLRHARGLVLSARSGDQSANRHVRGRGLQSGVLSKKAVWAGQTMSRRLTVPEERKLLATKLIARSC